MAVRTVAINSASDMDAVDATTAGATATDVTVLYDNSNPIGDILTALENAKNVILRDLS